MTTVNTLLNVEDLTLTEPSIAFDAVDEETKQPINDIRFMSIMKNPGERELTLRIYGKIGSELMTKYGETFFFKPNDGEVDNLLALEKLTDDEDIPDKYEFRSALNKQYHMNIKLKKDKDGVYNAIVPFTSANAKEMIVRGKECCIEATPSFYFTTDGAKHHYGVFYKLKNLRFNDDHTTKATNVTKAVKAKSRK